MKTKSPSLQKRTNIYLRRPTLLFAVQQAIKLGIIRAGSASEWIETQLAAKVREVAPRLRKDLFRLGLDDKALTEEGMRESAK